jgi:tetratricopeptide (TPR) repeat protein
MTTTKAALTIMLMIGGATPALAQYGGGAAPQPQIQEPAPRREAAQQPAQQPTGQPERQFHFSRAEQTALAPVLTAVRASDWAAAAAALPAADAAARGADAKYTIAQVRLRIGINTSDTALQSRAIDDLIASGGAQPGEMANLYRQQMQFARTAGDNAKAERAMAQLTALNPNDTTMIEADAVQKGNARDYPGAIAAYQRAIQITRTANQPVPERWRRQLVALAYNGHLPQLSGFVREWLTSAPTPANWHDALAIAAEQNADLKLDAFRLMRAAGAMNSEGDFIQFSQAANAVRAFGEVQAVLQDGLQRNLIVRNAPYARETLALATRRATDDRASLAESRRSALAGTAVAALNMGDAYYGYGQYAEAAELYRAALQKGTDANIGNLRLGAALAQGGQRPQAEAAFRAVTGAGADLAQLWLLWLATHSG